MPNVFYLAYGSNLHPPRLTTRVSSSRVVGVVEMLGFRLSFHKRSIDSSGKCMIYAEQGQHHKVYGVLYEFDCQEKAALDVAEGKGNGYCEQLMKFSLNGEAYTPYVYVAQSTHIDSTLVPYHWYKDLVLAGARYHGLPDEYIASIEATPSKPDLNFKRKQENEYLLRQMSQVYTFLVMSQLGRRSRVM